MATLTVTLDSDTTMHTDDIVTFLFGWKRNVGDDTPSDDVDGPRSFPLTHSGYDRALYLDADHVVGGNVRQLVATLREVSGLQVIAGQGLFMPKVSQV